jgi:hypothetical protein
MGRHTHAGHTHLCGLSSVSDPIVPSVQTRYLILAGFANSAVTFIYPSAAESISGLGH